MAHKLRTELGGWGTVRNPLDDGETFEVDDGVVTVDDEETARALDAEYDRLTRVEDADAEEADDEAEDESEAEEEFDADEFVDRTPMDDVVSDIESGEADDNLDAIEEAAERAGVRAAVKARRDELEGE